MTRKAMLGSYFVYTVLVIVGSHGLLEVACGIYTMGSAFSQPHSDDKDDDSG